jgi:ABC-type branched-subunit amino acid transport system ATPase component/ABC-type branched-subunit amino acid transport system permease subunit
MKTLLKFVSVVAAFAVAGALIDDRFWLQVLTLTLIWATAGLAWNIPATAGQISLGHSAFVGIGAYTFVLLFADHDVNPWLGMLVAMVVAALVAVVIGLPTFRLQGFYFTLATMAVPLILLLLVVDRGYPEVSVPFDMDGGWASMQFRDPRLYVWLALGFFAVTLAIALAVAQSRFGRILRAVKDNEVLARSVGLHTLPWKLGAFALSAALCAAVGVLWVNAVLLVVTAEETFGLAVVILMISVTFVGGIGTPWGPVVGASLLIPLGQLLTAQIGDRVPGAEELIYGLALVLAALVVPRGIVPTLADRFRKAPAPIEEAHLDADASVVDLDEAAKVPAADLVEESDEVLLSVESVAKRFGGVTVLSDVTFEVRRGARIGLIGPNGAGKTTLFNLLTGHLRPDGGTIVFAGRDIGGLNAPARCDLGIARTFQVPQGFPSMTPYENVQVAAVGVGVKDVDTAVMEALRIVGLVGKAHSRMSAMTTLDSKMLELARAIVGKPRLLLLDEPLAGLNKAERKRFFSVLGRAAGEETAVVVIEHSVRSLIAFTNHLIALDQGRVIASGDAQDVVADEQVATAYLGRRWAARGAPASPIVETGAQPDFADTSERR